MNLAELRRAIESRLRWAPTTAAHRNDLTDRINRALYDLAVGEPTWPWALKRQDIVLYADEPSVAQGTFTNGSAQVSMIGPATAKTKWNGHYIDAPDGVRYEVAYSSDGDGAYWLTTNYGGSTTTAPFSVRYRWFNLPSRCADVQAALIRDESTNGTTQPLASLTRTEEYRLDLSREEDSRTLPSAFIIEEQAPVVEPVSTPTITPNAAASTLTVGTTYRYFYTVVYSGREGPPSEVVERAPDAGNPTNRIGLPSLAGGSVKRLYRSTAKSPYFQLLTTIQATVTQYDDNGSASPTTRYDETHYRRRFRVWPLPDEDYTLDMLYVEVPRALTHDTDQPPFDPSYHEVLAFIVARDVMHEVGEFARANPIGLKMREMLSRMRNRYFGTAATSTEIKGYACDGDPLDDVHPTVRGRGTPSIT